MPKWKEDIAHFELYRILKNKILEKFEYQGIEFCDIIPEYSIENGRADLVIFVKNNGVEPRNPFIVIEVKRGKMNRNPASNNKIVEQAKKYAQALNAPYYIITDSEKIAWFKLSNNKMNVSEGLIANTIRPGRFRDKQKPNISLEKWLDTLKELVRDYQDGE
ncbi:MAG: type I restriction enzyme HsdR N-terminal domain-containing protein [Candidatus Helarchaeota archaeon]